jgi:hypothetical protein
MTHAVSPRRGTHSPIGSRMDINKDNVSRAVVVVPP